MADDQKHLLEAGSLRIEFSRYGDRWQHQIGVVEGGRFQPVLFSIEEPEPASWPISPPLQEFQVEHRQERKLAMLVGMAGASHWSMTMDLDPSGIATFDVACRFRPPAEQLGSGYLAANPAFAWEHASARQSVCTTPHGRLALTANGDLRLSHEANGALRLAVPLADQPAAAQTVRWSYSVQISRV